MLKFNVGDKVKVVKIKEGYEYEDLYKEVGKVFEIDKVESSVLEFPYSLKGDVGYMWAEEELELVEYNKKEIDKEKIEQHFREILIALGENPDREGLRDTPKRVAKAYAEIFEGLNYTNEEIAKMYDVGFEDEDVVGGENGFGEFVSVNHIKCYSSCEHHFLPMTLDVNVAYIPNEKVLGLSKMPRIVKMVSRRPQLQERINRDIFDVMSKILGTEDIIVQITGTHMCMSMRGVQETNSETKTLFCGGKFETDRDLRKEFMSCL